MYGAGLHSIETSDIINLPDQIAAKAGAVESLMASLKRIYKDTRFAPLCKAIKAKILSVGERTPDVCRQAVIELLRVCDDPQIASQTWTYNSEIRLSFLMESASTMPEASLACALNHVCKYGRELNLSEKIPLLAVYLERLKKRSPPYTFSLTYEPMLIELLEAHLQSDHLKAYPKAIEAIEQSLYAKAALLLSNLRQSLPIAKTAPRLWWKEMLEVQGRIQERNHIEEFDAIFLEALTQVHKQEGFADVFNRVANRVLERKDEKALLSIMSFLRSSSFQQADRAFLINLLCFLTSRLEKTTPDEAVGVHFLCDSVKPASGEIPHLLDYFLAYYPTLLNLETAGLLIDDIRRSLGYFSSSNDTRIAPIIHQLVAVLMKAPKNKPLWSNFAGLLSEMEKIDLFLEDSIVVLETVASQTFINSVSIKSPPFECFKQQIVGIKKRLGDDQKTRLAKACGAVFAKAAAERREIDFNKAVPSIEWVREQLKKEGSQELVPAAVSKPKPQPDPQDAESQIRVQFKKALRGQYVSLKNLLLALSLLEKLPSPEWELWMKLFACRVEEISDELMDKAWSLWIEKHPIKDYQSKDAVCWEKAIKSLLSKVNPRSSIFITFLTHHALDHVERLQGEACKIMTGACLEMGISSCWDERNINDDILTRLQSMHAIIESPAVRQQIGLPIRLLEKSCQTLLHLLFAHQPQGVLYTAGETRLLSCISSITSAGSYKSDTNQHLFDAYCMHPYIPSSIESQRVVVDWVVKSWPVLLSKIGWVEACCLLRAVSQFDYEGINPESPFTSFYFTCKIWDKLIEGLPTRVSLGDISNSSFIFSDLTRMLMEKIAKYNKNPENALYLLNVLRERFQSDVWKFVIEKARTQFQLQYCAHVFSLASLNTSAGTVIVALAYLNANHAYLKENPPIHCKSAVKTFAASLPTLVNLVDPALIQESVDKIKNIPWVVDTASRRRRQLGNIAP